MKLKSQTGTYVLVLVSDATERIEVGALGNVTLTQGTTYLYVGSAFGAGGVASRVQRHARTNHAKHWHIDYIRAHCAMQGAWVSYSDSRLECRWARALLDAEAASVPQSGVGSSDCTCKTHFIRWDARDACVAKKTVGERIQKANSCAICWMNYADMQ